MWLHLPAFTGGLCGCVSSVYLHGFSCVVVSSYFTGWLFGVSSSVHCLVVWLCCVFSFYCFVVSSLLTGWLYDSIFLLTGGLCDCVFTYLLAVVVFPSVCWWWCALLKSRRYFPDSIIVN
jgi:hypothetical protein